MIEPNEFSEIDPCEGCGAWCEDGCPREELVKTINGLKGRAAEKKAIQEQREEDCMKVCDRCYHKDHWVDTGYGCDIDYYFCNHPRHGNESCYSSLGQMAMIHKGYAKPCSDFIKRTDATCSNCASHKWRAAGYYCAEGKIEKKCKVFSRKEGEDNV